MPVEFVAWDTRFPLHRKAREYLGRACARSRLSDFTPDRVIADALDGRTTVYLVTDLGDVIGCFTLSLRNLQDGRILELPLLGGVGLAKWRDNLVEILFQIAAANRCTRFSMIGRRGFERLFPELEMLCCVYGRNLT